MRQFRMAVMRQFRMAVMRQFRMAVMRQFRMAVMWQFLPWFSLYSFILVWFGNKQFCSCTSYLNVSLETNQNWAMMVKFLALKETTWPFDDTHQLRVKCADGLPLGTATSLSYSVT